MEEKQRREVRALREVQANLRWRLDALERRIDLLTVASEPVEGPPDLPFPPTLPVPVPIGVFLASSFPHPEIDEPVPPDADEEPVPVSWSKSEETKPARVATASVEPGDSFELRLGRVWLVRMGIVVLLTGVVFLGNFAWQEFISKIGPAGKLALIYLTGAGLSALGWWVKRKRAELAAYGKVLIGGGIATVYYATYAAHFVDPLRVIPSPWLGGALLLVLAGGILWLSDRLRSEAIASVTVILGFYTAAINPVEGFSLFSNLLLSVVAIILLVRHRWMTVSFVSLAGCYLAYGFWRFHSSGTLGVFPIAMPDQFWTALLFPACYWVVFTVATFVGRSETTVTGFRPAFLTVNNGIFFGLTAPLVAGTFPDQLWWCALAFGAVLIALSRMAARTAPVQAGFDGTYLAQGLTLLVFGLILKFSGYQLALIFALQSATLLQLSIFRHGRILQVFSGLSAVLAAGYVLVEILNDAPHALITGGAVAVVLMGTAWLFKSQRGYLNPIAFHWRAAAYVALGEILLMAVILKAVDGAAMIYAFLGIAIVQTLSLRVARMPELVWGGQGMAWAGLVAWFSFSGNSSLPVVPFLASAGSALFFMHWWQRETAMPVPKLTKSVLEAVYVGLALAVVYVWLKGQIPNPWLLVSFAGAALGFLSYGLLSRSGILAVGSQVFSVAVVANYFYVVVSRDDPWLFALAAIVLFLAQSFVTSICRKGISDDWWFGVRRYNILIQAGALIFGLLAVQVYVPDQWQFLAIAAAAFGIFVIVIIFRNPEALAFAGAAAVLAVVEFVSHAFSGEPVFVANFAGFALALLAQRLGVKRLHGMSMFPKTAQHVLIGIGVSGIWLMIGRWVADLHGTHWITIAWSLLAFVVLGCGFLLHDRMYRIAGLVILMASIVRVFLVDVWQLETILRILSFLVLGAVLIALGFVYNRFANTLRKWIE